VSARTEALRHSLEQPAVSIVVPVFDEAANLAPLCAQVLEALAGESLELIFVNDGSRDDSLDVLRALAAEHREVVVVDLVRNFGQHPAIVAGFSIARGSHVITLDADLQNPPTEIPRLLAELRSGHDLVGSVRVQRSDGWLRRSASSAVNQLTTASLGVGMRDYGCMLRGYSARVAREIVELAEQSVFIPALAMMIAAHPTEIEVQHEVRSNGRSRYSVLRLLRLGFDLVTGFSLLPIQLVSLSGIAVSAAGLGLAGLLFVRRLLVGPESEGVFTLFAILFFFLGVLLFAVGLVGEYVGRIYAEVRRRPIYRIREIVGQTAALRSLR